MKHALATLLLFVPLLQAQTPTGSGTANYIAKWSSSSNLTTSALCQSACRNRDLFPHARLQVNSGNVLVRGVNNFTAAGHVAKYYVGDTNHVVGAAYAAGLFFSTYKNPYAIVIQNTSGFVGVGTNAPRAALDVQPNTTYCTHCPVARLGSFTIDYANNTNISGDFNSSSEVPDT